jgi:hypothetical protein
LIPDRVVGERRSPDFLDDVGGEILAPVVGEDDVADAKEVVDGPTGEPFDVDTVELERPI